MMKKNAGRKGRKLGAYGRKKYAQPTGFVCGFDDTAKRRAMSLRALKNGGKGYVFITGSDAHLIRQIIKTLDEQPECASIYNSQNGNTQELMKHLDESVCADCQGNGWWLSCMGEGADPCPTCKGTGAKAFKAK